MLLPTLTVLSLLNQCQSVVDPNILMRLVKVESSLDEFAVAVVGMNSVFKPSNKDEAINYINELKKSGANYSVGLMQVNQINFPTYDLTNENVFDHCKNIYAGANIYSKCFMRAQESFPEKTNEDLLNDAASCYYSGNFTTGYKKNENEEFSYVEKFNKFKNNLITDSETDFNNIENVSNEITIQKPQLITESWDVFADFSR